MRFRLRYLHHDLELATGEFALGRSPECQLSLDDPLVSRRHARLIVAKDGVAIEDLQSRNGVTVNGRRISARTPLSAGDKIMIGSQELTLLLREAPERELLSTTQVGQRTLPRIAAVPASSPPPTTMAGPSPRAATSSDTDIDAGAERRTHAFSLLGGVADKAFAMGRADEAERLLANALAEVLEASRSGKRPAPSLVDVAARFAAKLATATAKGTWADYVIELYDAEGRLCPAAVIDELYNALRKVNAIDLVRLRAYVVHLREGQAIVGPAEKFLLQRIEGLERLAALR
jgi:hypothetical protein